LQVALAVLAAGMAGGLAWVAFSFVPLRPVAGGVLAAPLQTPASAHQRIRAVQPDAEWPLFGASPARTRYVPSELRPPFRLLYTIRGGGLIEMPPVVAQGRVVFGTHKGDIIATRVADGSRAWVAKLDRCIASSPAVHEDVVYVGWSGPAPCRPGKDERGGVVALSLATGAVLWRFGTGNVESSPAIVEDTLYFSAFRTRSDSTVYAMRLTKPRRMLWSVPIASKVASSPALVGRRLYVAAYDRNLYTFDARTGRLIWKTSAFSDDATARVLLGVRSLVRRNSWSEGGYYGTPALAYRRAFVGAIEGVFSAFDSWTGEHAWSRKLGGSIYGSAAIWREKVYVGTTGGSFYALSAHDGHVLWKRELPGKILGSPTVTNDRVYISTTARETYVLHARTGEIDWRFADGQYSPLVIADTRAFLVGKGRVYALENAWANPGCRTAIDTGC
jgi:outer membrane protein assembly factor BamB